MKNAGLFVIALVLGLVIGFDLGPRFAPSFHRGSSVESSYSSRPPTMAQNTPPSAPPVDNKAPTAAEWQDYQTTRRQVLQSDPQLASEYKELLGEINRHQKDIETAMVKADPKVAPVVAKLADMREHNFAQTTSGLPGK